MRNPPRALSQVMGLLLPLPRMQERILLGDGALGIRLAMHAAREAVLCGHQVGRRLERLAPAYGPPRECLESVNRVGVPGPRPGRRDVRAGPRQRRLRRRGRGPDGEDQGSAGQVGSWLWFLKPEVHRWKPGT